MDSFVIADWADIHYHPGEDFCLRYSPKEASGEYHAPSGLIIASSKNINISVGGLYRIVQTLNGDAGMEIVLSYNGHKKKRTWELCTSPDKWMSAKSVGMSRFSPTMKDYVRSYPAPSKEVWSDYIEFLKSSQNNVTKLLIDVHNRLGDGEDFDWDAAYRENLEACLSLQKSQLATIQHNINSAQTRLNQAKKVQA